MAPFTYYGFVGPAGIPANIGEQLSRAFAKIAAAPETATQLQQAYITPVTGTRAEFRTFDEKDIDKWRKLGKTVKIEF